MVAQVPGFGGFQASEGSLSLATTIHTTIQVDTFEFIRDQSSRIGVCRIKMMLDVMGNVVRQQSLPGSLNSGRRANSW